MRALKWLVFLMAVALVGIVTAPALQADDDFAYFYLSSPTRVGDVTLDPGTYMFRVTHSSNHSVVFVKNHEETRNLAAVLVLRHALPINQIEEGHSLVFRGDTLEAFVHEEWRYGLVTAPGTTTTASAPRRVVTEIAMTR